MKTFFDGVFISASTLYEAGIEYPIKLEYYKTASEENVESKYGIEIVKIEYQYENVKIETKEINSVFNNEKEQEKILTLLRNNEVTPFGVEEILQEMMLTCKEQEN